MKKLHCKSYLVLLLSMFLMCALIGSAQTNPSDIKSEIVNLYNKSQEDLSEGRFESAIKLKSSVYVKSKDLEGLKLIGGLCAIEIALYYSSVHKDLNKYIEWLIKSDECGYPEASGRLGDAYLTGQNGVPQDYNKAKYYYDKSNDGRCKWIIATMYGENGELGRNDSEWLKYTKMAVQKGEPNAQFYLGLYYIYGKIVPKDINNGIELIKKAAEQNYINALRFLES